MVEQQNVKAIFEDFDLDTSAGYNLDELHREIIRQGLTDSTDFEVIAGKSGSSKRPAAEQLITSLIDFDDVDYDEVSDLLYKLAGQAVEAIRNNAPGITEDDLNERVHAFRQNLADNIYKQMKEHYRIIPEAFKINKVLPFSKILDQPIIVNKWGELDFHDPVPSLKSTVIKFVYVGFRKSYYTKYRFDSSTELDFAFILETNNEVLKWIRPVPNQFNIYWSNGAKNMNRTSLWKPQMPYICAKPKRRKMSTTWMYKPKQKPRANSAAGLLSLPPKMEANRGVTS